MIRAIWILQDIGSCLYRYAAETRFRETDENLFSGFFAALQTFAKSIGGGEVSRLELRDLSLWFKKGSNVSFVVASDRGEDMSETLLRVNRAFDEALPDPSIPFYNPLIPSDVTSLSQRIDSKIKSIVLPAVSPISLPRRPAEQLSKSTDTLASRRSKPRPVKKTAAVSPALGLVRETAQEPKRPKTAHKQLDVAEE